MSFRNDQIPRDTVPISASASPVNYMGILVLADGDITYTTAAGNSRALTAVPAGTTIVCQIVAVTACTATALGYVP